LEILEKTAQSLGTQFATSNSEAINDAHVVFLCVKPAQALQVLSEAAHLLVGKLVISIVAGIKSNALHAAAGGAARVIRTMPNTAVRLRKGITAVSPHSSATHEDLKQTLEIFSSVGTALQIDEVHLDAVTAVSGSGPAFALLMLEALIDGGVAGGLDPVTARICASGALSAAAALVMETGETPLALRQEITSPGGTTAAGLHILETGNLPLIVHSAVHAARSRSMELSAKA
jgi:pyrroline-5-carboxylate reductase